MNKQPIGVFDSGYGGLTILKEFVKELPSYDFLYLGDNARSPYGEKDFDTVYEYTLQAVKWFFDQGCHLVILACNTASAKALRTIQQKDLPYLDGSKRVLGVIRPTSEVIGNYSTNGHVGVMGTFGTVISNSYLIEIAKFFPDAIVTQQACPEWVSLVENHLFNTKEVDYWVEKYIKELFQKDEKIDTVLLACTHYPLLLEKIQQFMPKQVRIISQGKIIAESLKDYLSKHAEIEYQCTKNQELLFYTTGDLTDFNNHASVFFGSSLAAKGLFL
jgi:glutamate racemase